MLMDNNKKFQRKRKENEKKKKMKIQESILGIQQQVTMLSPPK
jgi:hypothetical protein